MHLSLSAKLGRLPIVFSAPEGGDFYLQPGGTTLYRRPDGTSLYKRPAS